VDRIGVVEENVDNKGKILFVEFWVGKVENSINETHNNSNFMSNWMVKRRNLKIFQRRWVCGTNRIPNGFHSRSIMYPKN